MAEFGQERRFAVALEISRERPFKPAREVTPTVDTLRRHQRGEAVEQMQRRKQQRAVPARIWLGALVEQTLGNEFAPPI